MSRRNEYRFYKDQEGNDMGHSWTDNPTAVIKAVVFFSVLVALLILAWLCR